MTNTFVANKRGYFKQPLFNVIYSYMELASQDIFIDISLCTVNDDVLIHKKMSEIDTNMEKAASGEPYILRMKIRNVMLTFETTQEGVLTTVYRYSDEVLASPRVFNPTIIVINN